MKDKLVKFNRKAPYYRFRRAIIAFSILALVAAAISIPISLKIAASQAEAEEANTNEVIDT
ncbi:MAG: hypothetical protein WCX85_00480 [Bacilli bacterium]|jgi:hypothetical protein|nr:hypothetical protein [Bacilli bacterium]